MSQSRNQKKRGWIAVANGLDFESVEEALHRSRAESSFSPIDFLNLLQGSPYQIDGRRVVRIFHAGMRAYIFFAVLPKGRVRTYLTNERPHVFDSPLDLKKHFESHPGSVAALAVPDFFAGDPV